MLGMVRHPALATGRPAMTRHHRVHEHHGESEQENECAAPYDGATTGSAAAAHGAILGGHDAVVDALASSARRSSPDSDAASSAARRRCRGIKILRSMIW